MKSFVRGTVALASAIVLSCCLPGCSEQLAPQGSEEREQQNEAVAYGVGDSVETDIVRFTLDRAELAIAVENSGAATFGPGSDGLAKDSYFMPKEYDPEDDANNPFVAAKGHTLVSITFSVENLDRASVELDDTLSDPLFSIEYDGVVYPNDESSNKGVDRGTEYGAENENGEGWKSCSLAGILLSAGQASSYKCYVDIPVEIDDLDSDFKVIVNLPNSAEETESFEYAIEG